MKSTVRPKSKSSGFSSLFDFSFFGCNRPKIQVQKEEPNSFKGLRHPSNCMQCPSGPTQASLNSEVDFNFNSLKLLESSQINDEVHRNSSFDQYPINEVFMLGKQEKIIAKIITRKICEASQITSSLLSSVFGVFSQKESVLQPEGNSQQESACVKGSLSVAKLDSAQSEKGMQIEGMHDMTPGNVARHIAHRLKCEVIIDALCGYGETTLQLAKFCNSVIAIGADTNKNPCAQQSFEESKLSGKITFLSGELVQMNDIKGDVVFLNPSVCTSEKQIEHFSIFKHLKTDLVQLLVKSLEITSKVALKLPGNTDFDEVVKLFSIAISQKNLPLTRFCIEIEQIINSSEQLEFILVFFGDCSSIDVKEEYEAAYNYLCCNESLDCKANYTYHVVSALFEKVGMPKTISYTMKLKEQNRNRGTPNAPVLEGFLELLIKEKIYSREELSNLVEEETKRRSSSLFNVTDSYECSLTCRDRKSTLFKNLNNYTEAQRAAYLYQNGLSLDVNALGKTQLDQAKFIKNIPKSSGDIQDKFVKWSSPRSPVPNFQGDLPDPSLNKRVDDSDLEISSYSVATDYLDDLESEEYMSFTRSRSITQVFQLEKGANSLIAESLLDTKKNDLISSIAKTQTMEGKI